MAPKSGAVWAIDIGCNSLKALHLSDASGVIEVIGFENISHGKILAPGSGVRPAERDELIALSLRQFVESHNLKNDEIIISVPSQNSFARFVTLPPVEEKRIPEIVKFEAAQQIPFDINDVQWDWQLMSGADSAEKKVGIFAIKNMVVDSALEHFEREALQVGYVQMAPMALYNYLLYDRADLCRKANEGIVVINTGAENTDLVICTPSMVWQRSIPMGGNSFTKAIADAFKLNFQKAEKLKRTAPMSKYARQILQAMKPVFTDLASEIQRSMGFYTGSNPNTKLVKVIALGGGTKMRGLLKYLQQTLQIPVERPDSFKRLKIGEDVSEAKFHENVCDFGIVYGLGVQALGAGKIESNLLPASIARSMAWKQKSKYFIIASVLLLLVSILGFARTNMDRVKYAEKSGIRRQISRVIETAKKSESQLKELQGKGPGSGAKIQKQFDLFKNRDIVAKLNSAILSNLPNAENNPDQADLYKAFSESNVAAVLRTDRKDRKQVFVTQMSVYYVDDVESEPLGQSSVFKTIDTGSGSSKGRSATAVRSAKPRPKRPARRPKRSSRSSRNSGGDEAKKIQQSGPGFIVSMAGYSPYGSIGELMDPVGVENAPDKWGLITRLMHLGDSNKPGTFKLFRKSDIEHFTLETAEIEMDSDMPAGIGVEKIIEDQTKKRRSGGSSRTSSDSTKSERTVLIDPMTKEVICKVAELDEYGREKFENGKVVYNTNDHWFRINAKFLWSAEAVSEKKADEGKSRSRRRRGRKRR